MAAPEVPAATTLAALGGETRTIDEWLITFQLLGVVLDPFTYESSWLLETSGRILETFRGASVRICFIVTASADQAREFLGPWAERMLVYVDPDRSFVKACGLEQLPALVHIRQNRQLEGAAEGWRPEAWRRVVSMVAQDMAWSKPVVPASGDPAPYAGSPALGTEVRHGAEVEPA
jgi:hypothetical protein